MDPFTDSRVDEGIPSRTVTKGQLTERSVLFGRFDVMPARPCAGRACKHCPVASAFNIHVWVVVSPALVVGRNHTAAVDADELALGDDVIKS